MPLLDIQPVDATSLSYNIHTFTCNLFVIFG